MQSIIETLQRVAGGSPGLVVGFTFIGAFTVQMVVLAFSSAQRAINDRGQRRLVRERLQLQVKAAALQCQEAEQAKQLWNGYRKFQIARKVKECEGVWAFYLQPHDGRPAASRSSRASISRSNSTVPGRDKPVGALLLAL
jgi:uncharacterized protein